MGRHEQHYDLLSNSQQKQYIGQMIKLNYTLMKLDVIKINGFSLSSSPLGFKQNSVIQSKFTLGHTTATDKPL